MVLKLRISALEGVFNLIYGVEDRGVVLIQLFSNIRGTQVGQLSDQIDRHLPRLSRTLVFQCAAEDGFINGIEFTDLTDDQCRGGQSVAFGLEHIRDGTGDVVQVHGHIV